MNENYEIKVDLNGRCAYILLPDPVNYEELKMFKDIFNRIIECRIIEAKNAKLYGNSPMSMPIDELDLSVRAVMCLKRAGIENFGQLLAMNQEELKKVRNLGQRTLTEINEMTTKVLAAQKGNLISVGEEEVE